MNLYRPQLNGGDYLAFLGRISPEKRPDRAIQIAVEAGMKLKIAAKVDKVDREYFEAKIKPMLDSPGIEFVGEITDAQKSDLLGQAYAYICPIDWPEPFGLTMIEAMACGTPTIAFRCGSVPEILEDGLTGFVVQSNDEALSALKRVPQLNRALCRATFERRFTACRMAKDHLDIYEALADNTSQPQTLHTMELAPTVWS